MHKHKIVNRDIKPENIMINYNKHDHTINVRYIDFGLSEYLTKEYCSQISNIGVSGTVVYMSLEMFISDAITRDRYSDNHDDGKILSSITHVVDKHMKYLKNLHIDITNFKHIKTKVYNNIKKIYNNSSYTGRQNLLNKYYGNTNILNGYLQKSDIYSLGLTIYEFVNSYILQTDGRKNIQLYDLIYHMIKFDPEERYNVIQCLQHPYFSH